MIVRKNTDRRKQPRNTISLPGMRLLKCKMKASLHADWLPSRLNACVLPKQQFRWALPYQKEKEDAGSGNIHSRNEFSLENPSLMLASLPPPRALAMNWDYKINYILCPSGEKHINQLQLCTMPRWSTVSTSTTGALWYRRSSDIQITVAGSECIGVWSYQQRQKHWLNSLC